MTHYTETPCPNCRRALRVRTEYAGKVIVCNYCDRPFRINLPAEGGAEPRDDKIVRLSRQLASEDDRAAQLTAASREAPRLRAQLEQAGRDLDAARKERDQARDELSALRHGMSALSAGHEQRLSSLTGDLEGLRESHKQAEAARAEAVRTAEELQAGIAQLEEALRQAAEGHAAALDEARGRWEEQATAARRELEGERSALQAQIARLLAECEGLRDANGREAARGGEVATIHLTQEIDRLGQAFEAAAARERELEGRIEAARAEQQRALAALEADRDAARAEAQAERGRAARTAEELKRSAEAQCELSARLRSLREELDAERAARQGEADGLRGQVEALGKVRDQLAAECNRAERRRREDEGRFRGEIQRLEGALADATRQHQASAGEGERSAAAARALDEQLAAARRDLAEKGHQLAKLTEGQGKVAAERQSLRTALETVRRQLDQERAQRQREAVRQRDEQAALRDELDAARAVTAEACARADRAAEQQARLAERHQEAQDQLSAARQLHAALHEETERLRGERDDALRRAEAAAAEGAAVAAARREPASPPAEADDESEDSWVPGEPEESWVDVGAAYEAAVARDLGRAAPERRPQPERPNEPPPVPSRRLPLEEELPTAAEPRAREEPARRRGFPVWACLPLALLLWVASLPAGRPLEPRDSALTLLLGLTLLLQFRLWDEIGDAGDGRPLRPGPPGPLQLVMALAAVWNAAYIVYALGWPLLVIFVALSVFSLLWNKGLRGLFPGPVASSQVALLRYPVMVYLLAAPAPPSVPEGTFLLALVLVYLGFSVFALLHDERLQSASGSAALLALAMVLMLAVSAVMTAGLPDDGTPARTAQVLLTGGGAAVFLLLFWRRRIGRAAGSWAYLVFAIAFAWLANFALAGHDLMALWADLRGAL